MLSIAAAKYAGAEVIVANGREKSDWPQDVRNNVRWLERPGQDVFALRAILAEAATDDVIVFTEDHCRPVSQGWCDLIKRHFAEHPECLALGGAVVNGSSDSLVDRANFEMNLARFSPQVLTAKSPAIASMAVRRAALPERLPPGRLEYELMGQWRNIPGAISMSPEWVTEHVQWHGFLGTFLAHFDNGRTMGGLLRELEKEGGKRHRGEWVKKMVKSHITDTQEALRLRGASSGWTSPQMLAIGALTYLHGFGAAIGLKSGTGSSPLRLR